MKWTEDEAVVDVAENWLSTRPDARARKREVTVLIDGCESGLMARDRKGPFASYSLIFLSLPLDIEFGRALVNQF